ncbi:MAG: rhodanese-like domain-containing protein [Bauldia sp.]
MARMLKGVDARGAAKLMKDGALMVDVREPGEYARGHIPGSQNVALSRFNLAQLPLGEGQAVVFFCASGNRTTVNAARLAAKAGSADSYVLQGGISAWGREGLPVESGSQGEGGKQRGFFARMFG